MSLTTNDLDQIRTIVREEVRCEVEMVFETRGREIVREEIQVQLQPLDGKLTAVENDVKELYGITDGLRTDIRRGFQRVNKRLDRLEQGSGLSAIKF